MRLFIWQKLHLQEHLMNLKWQQTEAKLVDSKLKQQHQRLISQLLVVWWLIQIDLGYIQKVCFMWQFIWQKLKLKELSVNLKWWKLKTKLVDSSLKQHHQRPNQLLVHIMMTFNWLRQYVQQNILYESICLKMATSSHNKSCLIKKNWCLQVRLHVSK